MSHGDSEEVNKTSKRDKKPENNEKLDFFSEKFDPLLALQVPDLKIPSQSAKKYDNLALYVVAMEQNKSDQPRKERKQETKVEIVRRWLPEQSR